MLKRKGWKKGSKRVEIVLFIKSYICKIFLVNIFFVRFWYWDVIVDDYEFDVF